MAPKSSKAAKGSGASRAPKEWQIGGRAIRVSNLDKLFWPEDGYTKGDMLRYYAAVAPVLLPYLKDRPVTLRVFPDGIHGFSYYRRDLPDHGPPRKPGTIGRPRVKGEALPKLSAVLEDPKSEWQRVKVLWYGGSEQDLEVVSGTGIWYRIGLPVLPIRWVLTRDPHGQLEPRAYFSTDQSQEAVEVVSSFIKRWTIEVTFEERVRRLTAHLGVETQSQWSDLAIERSTPCLLGMFSLVALFGAALHPDGDIPMQRTAWYHKTEATFSDVLGFASSQVRRQLWGNFTYHTSPQDPDVCLVPRSHVDRLAYAVCY